MISFLVECYSLIDKRTIKAKVIMTKWLITSLVKYVLIVSFLLTRIRRLLFVLIARPRTIKNAGWKMPAVLLLVARV